MENNKVVLLLSGGIDSTVLLFHLINKNYDIYPFYVNYGQTAYTGEIAAIKRIIKGLPINKLFELDIRNTSSIGCGSLIGEYPDDIASRKEWYNQEFFPNRNLLLLTLAAIYAYKINVRNIAIGVVGISYSDTSRKFIDETQKLLKVSLGENNIIAPYANMEREIVIKEAIEFNVPLELTFSCNSIGDRHCLLCTSCLDRENAFRIRNILLNKKS